jgi:hypothetical protein
MTERVDKDSLPLNQPRRTPSHPTKSHIVKTKVNGKEKIIRFGEQGASTAGKPKVGESDHMKAKRASFKSRHAANIAKGPASAAYWADKVKWADGGSVRTHYAKGDSVQAQPQNAALGRIADLLKQTYAPQRTQQMQGMMEFLGVPATARTLERMSYGQPITNINKANVPLLPDDTAEAAMLVAPPLTSLAKRVGTNLVQTAPAVARDIVQSATSPLRSYAVKPKGGNWAPPIGSQDSVEAAIRPLRPNITHRDDALVLGGEYARQADNPEVAARIQQNAALDKWLDTKLQKYIRNEMGTPEDPIRLAHEEGFTHMPGDQAEEFGSWLPEETAKARLRAGYPEEGFAVRKHAEAGYPEAMEANTRKAELWETLADNEITQSPAGAYQEQFRTAREMPSFVANGKQAISMAERNPWIEKLDRETPIYKIDSPVPFNENLGFNHMADEIQNMLDPESGLPAALRLTPQQLDKVSVKQMVEKVDAVNKWRAEEASKAELEGMMGNLSAKPRMQIPDTQLSFVKEPGMTWVDIPATVDESAMKLCTTIGRQAGWCTQGEGLAKRYGSGDNRLTTLIDAEGRPHAQAMIRKDVDQVTAVEDATLYMTPEQELAYDRHFSQFDRPPELDESLEWLKENAPDAYKTYESVLANQSDSPSSIIELKPVGNEFSSARAREYAKRDPQYQAKITDSVLKFLNAGEWSKVNDLDHYDIVDLQNPNMVMRALRDVLDYDLPHERMDKFKYAVNFNPDAPRFMSRSQFSSFVEPPPPPVKEQKMLQGFYRGFAGDNPDTAEVFATPQKRVADYYAQKRAGQTGEAPHAEMVLADPFAGKTYGHATAGSGAQEPMFTRAKKLKPEEIKSRTQLYAEGGMVGTPPTTYDPFQVDQIMGSINAPQNYAQGGSVSAYDPSRVDAIVNQFM